MKALVVDDSAVMRKVMIGALARAGIEDVAQAADGQEAVAACQGRRDSTWSSWTGTCRTCWASTP